MGRVGISRGVGDSGTLATALTRYRPGANARGVRSQFPSGPEAARPSGKSSVDPTREAIRRMVAPGAAVPVNIGRRPVDTFAYPAGAWAGSGGGGPGRGFGRVKVEPSPRVGTMFSRYQSWTPNVPEWLIPGPVMSK